VPLCVVSPWSKGGWVNSQVFDHTSVIRFIEASFGVMEPNISAWRRAVCGDLTSAFNFADPDDEEFLAHV
jgi:phospholipase C